MKLYKEFIKVSSKEKDRLIEKKLSGVDGEEFDDELLPDYDDETDKFRKKVEKRALWQQRDANKRDGDDNTDPIITAEPERKEYGGNIKLRMSTKLKKIFIILSKKRDTKLLALDLLNNIKVMECDISFFNTTENNELLTYLPRNRIIGLEKKGKNKKGKFMFNAYKSPLRQEMRLGRIINKLFPSKYTPRQIELFVNDYKGEHDMLNGNIGIEIVRGTDITYWYSHNHYNEKYAGGTLNKSCMKNSPKDYFLLYSDNPEVVEMTVYIRNNKLEARAIVWHTNEGIYMDRVYYNEDHLSNAFVGYAEKNGWMYRGQRNLPQLTVKLEKFRKSYLSKSPWMDSFYYKGNGVLTPK